MTEHTRAQELIAAAVADGLTDEEMEWFDAHLRDCPACATALNDARTLSGKLGSLFAAVRPAPALEDQVIQSLREAAARRRLLSGWRRKLAVGVAASVGIGLTGVAMDRLVGLSEVAVPASLPRRQRAGQDGSAVEIVLGQLSGNLESATVRCQPIHTSRSARDGQRPWQPPADRNIRQGF